MVSSHINADALPPLEESSYLGRKIAYNNRDWAAVYQNLRKVRRQWEIIVGVLVKTGATVRAQGMIYKAVAQSVLLYGSNIYVVTG